MNEPIKVIPPPSATSGKALASLILGVLSFFLGLLVGIPGFILGLLGMRDINRSQGRLTGRGLALAGLILSVLGTLVSTAISIIMIYAAFRAVETGREIQARAEVAQLDTAVLTFQTEWNVDHMPSSITLNDVNPQGVSGQYMLRMYRRLSPTTRLKWNGRDDKPVTLEGHECLVFFLGGIPSADDPPRCLGFSTNPQDPTDMSAPRKAPLFEFDQTRLRRNPKTGFLYYLDTSKQAPLAYFSAGRTPNGYNADDCSGIGSLGFDCGVPKPYLEKPGTYWRANSYQIISAGSDGKFGPGGVVWGKSAPITDGPGADDLANFAPGPLSKP